ncbi:MAG: transcription termination/antitermination protein NusG [Alphaproteobacteria bacterium]|nr:MAG: transcription termination/antitermination protein NusG [Alphaproteobacteria bacterium]
MNETSTATTENATPQATAPAAKPPRWYVLHVYSGFENKVAQAIRDLTNHKKIGSKVHDVMVPMEEVVEMRRGAKVQTERKFFPGYILVKAEMDDNVWHAMSTIPKVTGFVGGSGKGKPIPISDAEADRIIRQVKEGVERPRPSVSFEVGENVRVIDGPFASFAGTVEEVDENKSRVKVSVSIFGRPTPVDLDYAQVEKNAG